MSVRARQIAGIGCAAVLGFVATGCGVSARSAGGGRVSVVAAENFWGALASEIGGGRVRVRSIIVNPDVDPHSYEPNVGDAIAFARADVAIVNGIGYDPWAGQLLAADGGGGPARVDVGSLLGLSEGANPHAWYSPASVLRVVASIGDALARADPAARGYFEARERAFVSAGLAPYRRLVELIRKRYAGTTVGVSESMLVPLVRALGLRLITPSGFAGAVAEGGQVAAGDLAAAVDQARSRRIAVWLLNTQNVTPEVQRVNAVVAGARIPVAHFTETLAPSSAGFVSWQVRQLRGLAAALHEATGR